MDLKVFFFNFLAQNFENYGNFVNPVVFCFNFNLAKVSINFTCLNFYQNLLLTKNENAEMETF